MNLLYDRLIQNFSHFPTLLHYYTVDDELLIHRLEILMIDINGCSHAYYNMAIFLTKVVLSCEFLKMVIFCVK